MVVPYDVKHRVSYDLAILLLVTQEKVKHMSR